MEVNGQCQTLAGLLPGERALFIAQEDGWGPQTHNQCGHFGKEKNLLNPSRIEPEYLICPAYGSPAIVPITNTPQHHIKCPQALHVRKLLVSGTKVA
jgi:hypothetical protein